MSLLDHLGHERLSAGYLLLIGAAVFVVSVAVALRRVTPVIGSLCLGLSSACFAAAFGVFDGLVPEIGPVSYCVSGGCYALTGWALLKSRRL
jgi:hypothetical protein